MSVENDKPSEAAVCVAEKFNTNDIGLDFLSSTRAAFENFDELNRSERSKTFSEDVDYICQSTIDSLKSKTSDKFDDRIDSYFYIYHRLQEYFTMTQKTESFEKSATSNLEKFQQKFYEMLVSSFVSSKGTKPNLCSKDEDVLKHIDITGHLLSIKTIDTQTMNTFLVLCKLLMESLLEHNRPKWIDILSNIDDIKLSLQDFITHYSNYREAFQEYSIDMPTYIYLIQRLHPPKQISTSPFGIFIQCLRKLKLTAPEFFELFQPLFVKGIQENYYEVEYVNKFFHMIRVDEPCFYKYLTIYSSNVNTDDLWNLFIYLCTTVDINDVIKRHFTGILTIRISTVSVEAFSQYAKLAEEALTEMKADARSSFLEIFEEIYDSLVLTQIPDPQFSYRWKQTNSKDLLKIGLLLSSTHNIKRNSCLILIQHILFKIDNSIRNTAEKIKILFENINSFDDDLCNNNDPNEIIQDEWLKDFLISNSQIWLKLDQNIYEYLCNSHQHNHWIIYVWTRIVRLSLLKINNENSNDSLKNLNQWLKNVKHDIYDSNDILTIIFLRELFDIIISKYTKSILSLPNIDIIMKYILSIRQNQPEQIDTVQVDILIENGRKILEEILHLRSKYI